MTFCVVSDPVVWNTFGWLPFASAGNSLWASSPDHRWPCPWFATGFSSLLTPMWSEPRRQSWSRTTERKRKEMKINDNNREKRWIQNRLYWWVTSCNYMQCKLPVYSLVPFPVCVLNMLNIFIWSQYSNYFQGHSWYWLTAFQMTQNDVNLDSYSN